MRLPDLFLLSFAIGTIWTIAALLLGAGHGHGSAPHGTHGLEGGNHAGHLHAGALGQQMAAMLNPHSMAIFLAWFGGIGYLLTRHTRLGLWEDLSIAGVAGLIGAYLIAVFFVFLQSHEKPMDPSDYQMVGTLGRVTSTIHEDGVGELIYTRDGARRPVCARSEDGSIIGRDTEVVVTRYERGVAYVRVFQTPLSPRETRISLEN